MQASIWKREPAVLIGGLLAILNAVVAVVAAVVADLPANANWYQVVASVFLVGVPAVQALVTRQKVFSQATVEREIPVA